MNQPATVSKLAAELAGDMPEASEHLKGQGDTTAAGRSTTAAGSRSTSPDTPTAAPPPEKPAGKQSKGKKAINPADYAHLKDKHGFSFDSAVHKTNKDGTPKLTGAGLLWRKPGQRPKQSKSFIYQGAPRPGDDQAGPVPGPGTEAAHYEASGRVMAETIFSLGQMFFGSEWAPIQAEGMDERAQLSSAWAEYFRAKGINDIPPGVAVTIAMGSYALPRLARPTTKQKIGGFFGWIKNRKKKRPAPPPPPTATETTRKPPPADPHPVPAADPATAATH